MKILELVKASKSKQPEAFSKINDREAAKMAKAIFEQISRQIDEAGDGPLRVPGLGVFKIKSVERQKEGNLVMTRRVLLRPAVYKDVKKAAKPKRATKKNDTEQETP